jgi:sulfur-carrier protein
MSDVAVVRVVLPAHLRALGKVEGELALDVPEPVTIEAVLDALEADRPTLRGTIRDHATKQRRAFVRYYACQQDYSHDPPASTVLPPEVTSGREPFLVVGAMAGG